MITHIVLMKFRDRSPENIARLRDLLLTLPPKLPIIRAFEVGANVIPSDRAYELALYSTFDSRADLDAYATHPDHVEVLKEVRAALDTAASVDYES